MSDDVFGVKKTGIRHLLAAGHYSMGGARRLLKETAARHEIAAYLVMLALFAAIGARGAHYMALTVFFLLLLAVEALNTAIEEVVDHISRDYSAAARHAKDLGSFAVFCLLAINTAFAGYVLLDVLG
ncbi:MAG: diacylglycerol kinase [Phyllobacterium sp.]